MFSSSFPKEKDIESLRIDYPWLQPSTATDDINGLARSHVEAYIRLLQPHSSTPLACELVFVEASMEAFLAQFAMREVLLGRAKARAHTAYDDNVDDHDAMGIAAWDGLVAYATSTDDFVLLDVAQEVARQAAREVAVERVSSMGMDTGSSGGDAGGSRVYMGRENGKYATKAVARHSLASMPGWAALSKARNKATETTFMSVDSTAIDAAQTASLEAASQVAKRIAGMASLVDEAQLTLSWDLSHEAARHISWHTTWTPADAPDNPWTPLLGIWRAGLGVFRLLDGRYLVFKSA